LPAGQAQILGDEKPDDPTHPKKPAESNDGKRKPQPGFQRRIENKLAVAPMHHLGQALGDLRR
jgi:hypothetical protein